jgi:biopolymer transport protein TolR
MPMSTSVSSQKYGNRGRRQPLMSEINVTPFVDVMLVLLVIIMVVAPLITVGVAVDLPKSQAAKLDQSREPLTITINAAGTIVLQKSEIRPEELVPKLRAVMQARGIPDERIYVRGDKNANYGTIMQIMGQISAAGFSRVGLVTDVEQARR